MYSLDITNYENVFNNYIIYFTNNYQSVISGIFYGTQNIMTQCCICRKLINNVQFFNILDFPLESVRLFKNYPQNMASIYDCFEYYEKCQILTGQNQKYCNNCCCLRDAMNFNKIIISPNVMIISLNREQEKQINTKFYF